MTFPTLNRREILFELPMAQGWAHYAWLIESDPMINMERTSSGYIAQEISSKLKP